jgi:hypothetical protein
MWCVSDLLDVLGRREELMKRTLLWTTVVAVLSGGAVSLLKNQVLKAATVSPSPFTATAVTKFFDVTGTETGSEHSVYAVRSDGSAVRRVVRGLHRQSSRSDFTIVTDLSANRRITLNHPVKAVTTYPLSDGEVRHLRDVRPCVIEPGTPARPILGRDVFRRVRTYATKKGSIHEELWVDPSLDCHAFASATTFLDASGKKWAHNVMEVTSVIPGEPDRALFAVPADYTELRPSEVFDKLRSVTGKLAPSVTPDIARLYDGAYERARTRP